jgi:hypothetical protein
VCTNCHKNGHTVEKCWLINPCTNCGNLGHGEKQCPENKLKNKNENKKDYKNPKIREMFVKNVPSKKAKNS